MLMRSSFQIRLDRLSLLEDARRGEFTSQLYRA